MYKNTCTFFSFSSNILQADTDSRGLVISGQDASKVWRRQELESARFTSRSQTNKYPVHMSSVLKNRKQKRYTETGLPKKKKTPPFTQSKETAKTFRVGWDGKEKVGILKLMPYRMQNDDLDKHLSEQLDTLNACA